MSYGRILAIAENLFKKKQNETRNLFSLDSNTQKYQSDYLISIDIHAHIIYFIRHLCPKNDSKTLILLDIPTQIFLSH